MFGVDKNGNDVLSRQFSKEGKNSGKRLDKNTDFDIAVKLEIDRLKKFKYGDIRAGILTHLKDMGIIAKDSIIETMVEDRIKELAQKITQQGQELHSTMTSRSAIIGMDL